MGNKKNHAKKNKRQANNWRNIIKTRKSNKTVIKEETDSEKLHNNQPLNCSKNENINMDMIVDDTPSMMDSRETESKESEALDLEDDCLVMNYAEKQTYYSLQKLDPNQHTKIIRGDFHQSDERFVELSRGKQSLTTAIVAICFSSISNPGNWKTCDINNILIIGDLQYHASFKKMYREGEGPQTTSLLVSEVYPYIKIDRIFFYLNTMECLYFEEDVLNLENLMMSIKRFFHENEHEFGIFSCNSYSFAVMATSCSFFIFNPYAASHAGEPMNPDDRDSAACLMEMFTIICLANHLLVLCKQDASDCDLPVKYSMTKLAIEKIVFGENVSERNKVSRYLCNTASRQKASRFKLPKNIKSGTTYAVKVLFRKTD